MRTTIPLGAMFALLSAASWAPEALARGGGGSNGGGGGGGIFTLIALPFVIAYMWWKRKKIAEKNAKSEELLAKLARTDSEWAEPRVLANARRLFLEAQASWCAKDAARLRAVMAPDLSAKWEAEIAALTAKGWTNRMDRLEVRAIRVVEVRNYRDRLRDSFTACVEAAAEDYSIDASGAVVESNTSDDDKRAAKTKSFEGFVEYWTFLRRENGWVVSRVDDDGEWRKFVDEPLVDEE